MWVSHAAIGISGYDAGKKINGRKRHIVTDTLGIMLFVLVHAADVQDRDGAPALLQAIRHRCQDAQPVAAPAVRAPFATGQRRTRPAAAPSPQRAGQAGAGCASASAWVALSA